MSDGAKPIRVQLSRAKGWQMPSNTANTSRHRIPTNQMHDMNHRRVRRLGRHCVLLRHAQPSK